MEERDPTTQEPWNAGTAEVRQPMGNSAWELQHDPYTIEGQLEGYRKLAFGARRATGWRRVVGYVMVALVVGPFLAGPVLWIIRSAQELLFG